MVLTPSTMLALGTEAPDFSLMDVVSGRQVSLKTFAGKKALLVMFICRHCPYVQHVKSELARLGKDYSGKGIGIVAISSNDGDSYPEDMPESLKEMAEELGLKGHWAINDPRIKSAGTEYIASWLAPDNDNGKGKGV